MLQLIPASIMFVFTFAFASVFLIPATSYSPKNAVVGFYWNGVWAFLSAICAFAGAQQTLGMLDIPAKVTGDVFLQILILTFVIFVVFGWFRLAGKAALYSVSRFLTAYKKA